MRKYGPAARCRPVESVSTVSSDTWFEVVCQEAEIEAHEERIGTNFCDRVIYGLPPLPLLLDIGVEVTAPIKTVVHQDNAEIVLSSSSVSGARNMHAETYAVFLQLRTVEYALRLVSGFCNRGVDC